MGFLDFNIHIPFNFQWVIWILGFFIVLNFIIRKILYSFSPSVYINLGAKLMRWMFEKISNSNSTNEFKKRKMNSMKFFVEKTLCFIATVVLSFKNILHLFSRPLVLIILFVCGFKFILLDVTNTIDIYKLLKAYEPNDQFTLSILNSIISMLRLVVPLSLPFYYFAYREQKTISDSSLNGKTTNIFFVLFILFSLSSLGYAMTVTEVFNAIDSSELKKSLDATNKYSGDLALISLYLGLGLYFMFRSISELLSSITLKKLVDKKINKVYFYYLLMSFGRLGPFKKGQYVYLSYQLETVYQALLQSADKNLGNIYVDSFEKWNKVLDYMLSEYRLASFDTTTKHLYLLNKYQQDHMKFYRTILKNHKSLIMNLVKEHKIEDAKDAINKLLQYIPSPINLMNEQSTDEYYDEYVSKYYITLYEIIIYLYDNKNIGVDSVLDKINNESQTSEVTEQEGVIRNLQSLIIKTVANDDVKMLSSLSYYMNNFFNKNLNLKDGKDNSFKLEFGKNMEQVKREIEVKDEQIEEKGSDDKATKQDKVFMIEEVKDEQIEEKDSDDKATKQDKVFMIEEVKDEQIEEMDSDSGNKNEELNGADSNSEGAQFEKNEENKNRFLHGSIFILLQALLKSIELTHYKSTGFLVKFLITSYNSHIFNSVFSEFVSSPNENKYLLKKDLYKDIDDDFHMNENVEDYVLLKLFILIYGQQKYVIKHSVDFWELPDELLDLSIVSKKNYLNYMFKKLEKAKKEYGLMFLEDEKFMSELKQEFGVSMEEEGKIVGFIK
ncbi:hypothetical protein OB994_00100 [Bacillus cereus]|nr:hypothetical protein [Bacillus cereus]